LDLVQGGLRNLGEVNGNRLDRLDLGAQFQDFREVFADRQVDGEDFGFLLFIDGHAGFELFEGGDERSLGADGGCETTNNNKGQKTPPHFCPLAYLQRCRNPRLASMVVTFPSPAKPYSQKSDAPLAHPPAAGGT